MFESSLWLLTWNAAVVAVLALVVGGVCYTSFLRRRPALRHALWMLVLVKLVTPSLISVPILASSSSVAEPTPVPGDSPTVAFRVPGNSPGTAPFRKSPIPASAVASLAPAASSPPATEAPVPTERSAASAMTTDLKPPGRAVWLPVMVAVWIVGGVLLLGRSWIRARRLSRLLRRAEAGDERLRAIIDRAAVTMNVSQVAVRVVGGHLTPFIWVSRGGPLIVFPRGLVSQLDDEQLKSIACHELAHHLRRDLWSNAFALLVTSVCWWHPAAWLARREMRKAQELCCDELAISRCDVSRKSYLQTLFQAVEFVQSEPLALPCPASGFGGSRSLQARFETLASGRLEHRNSWCATTVVATLFVGLLCLPVVGRTEEKVKKPPAAASKKPSPKKRPRQPAPGIDFWSGTTSLALSRDSRYLLLGGIGTINLLDIDTGKKRDIGIDDNLRGTIVATAFRNDGQHAATGGHDNTARIWNVATGKQVGEPIKLAAHVNAVAFSPDGKTLLTGCANGSVKLWNLKTRTVGKADFNLPAAITAVAFSPDGKTIAAACRDKTARLWKRGGAPITVLKHKSPVTSLAFRSDGARLATGCADGTVQQWNPTTGASLGSPQKHNKAVQAVIYYSGVAGRLEAILMVAAGGSTTYREALTGRIFMRLNYSNPLRAVAFSKLLASRGVDRMKHFKKLLGGK